MNTDTFQTLEIPLLLLKADLTRVLDVLHWYYALIPIRERIRRSLTIDCIWMVLVYTAVLAAICLVQLACGEFPGHARWRCLLRHHWRVYQFAATDAKHPQRRGSAD